MSDETENPIERKDRRGTPPGEGTVLPPHGGRIGNPPFKPTPEQREKVRNLAKAFPVSGERHLAALMGFSRQTLRQHFAEELELGRAEMLAAIGSQMVNRALDADAVEAATGRKIARGDIEAQKFILSRVGGWSTKVEVGGKDGGPIQHATFDLSALSDDQKRLLAPVIDQLLAAAEANASDNE